MHIGEKKVETICGTVKRIKYRSEETGYSVFHFTLDNNTVFPDVQIVTGTYFKLDENEYLKIYGEYTINPKYGKQFTTDHYESCLPSRTDMLEKYLSMGMIKGIGAVRAKNIIQQFGDDTMDVLENHPERLAEVSGIGKRLAELIGKRMKEKGEMQEILFKLGNYGISPALGIKIYRKYRASTFHIIQTNPYKMIEDVRGIGFETADKIALSNGVHNESPYRIQSGIKYALDKGCSFGNVYLPQDKLMEEAGLVLKIPETSIRDQLCKMVEQKDVIQEEDRVYTKELYFAEKETAESIRRIIQCKKKRIVSESIMKKLGGNLDEVQMSAVRTAAKSDFMVLTGGPGVGKTTTTNLIIKYFEKERKQVLLAAPTGRAAKRMKEATGKNAQTIHRLLEVTGGEHGVRFERNKDNPLEGDVVIVDETSMMDIQIARALLEAVPTGTQVILVGDRNQLPSVGPGNVLADIIASGICPVVELKKIYRQAAGSHIISNAHNILNQQPLNLSNHSKDFFFKQCEDMEKIREMLLHYVADSLPAFTGEKDIQVLSPVRGRYLGINELNIALQNRLNPIRDKKQEIKGFRVGDKVIQIVNDYNRERTNGKKREMGVFNGDAGKVSRIDQENEYLYVKFEDGWTSCYEFDELENLSLAYALTIHKSQGSEYPVVVIPVYDYIPMLTTMNLLYTGITRAKKAILLIGDKKKLYQIIKNVSATKRYTTLTDRLKHSVSSVFFQTWP